MNPSGGVTKDVTAVAAGTTAIAAGVVTVREAVGLELGTALVGVALVVALFVLTGVIVSRHGLEGLATGLLGLGLATSTWNAVTVGPLKVTHLALALAALLLVGRALTSQRPVRAPVWVWVLGGTIALAALLTAVLPQKPEVYAGRYDVGRTGVPADAVGAASAATAAQWLVAAVALPLAVCFVAARRPGVVRGLAAVWVFGTALNGAAALGDELGLTRLSAHFLVITDLGGRQAGLTVQPNHAAVGIAMALPMATWFLARARSGVERLMWVGVAVILAGGLAATGSRAGLVAAAVAVALMVVVDAVLRRHLPALAVVGLAVAGVVVALAPGLLASVGQQLRLVNGVGADQSDAVRERLVEQAVDDVLGSPVHGIGLQVVAEAHNIYLQLLASGGVVLLLGFLAAQLGALTEAWSRRRVENGLGGALAVSAAAILLAGVVSNQVSDVFVYVPFALIAGLWSASPTSPPPSLRVGGPELEEVRS